MSRPMKQGWLNEGWARFCFDDFSSQDITNKEIIPKVRDSYDVVHESKIITPSSADTESSIYLCKG